MESTTPSGTRDALDGALRRLREMPPGRRAVVVSLAVVDMGLRVWALKDLKGRTRGEVRGPKAAWAIGLATVSSAGALPLTYFTLGRRSAPR